MHFPEAAAGGGAGRRGLALVLFLLAGAGPASADRVPDAALELAAGELRLHPLNSGERPLMVVVEQQGVDVVTTVRDGAGAPLLAVDGPGGRRGLEWLLVPPGGETLEVRAASGAGRVHLRFESPDGPRRRERLRLVRAASAAGERYLQGERGAALVAFRAAAAAGLGNARERAWIAYAAAALERETGRPTAAATLETARGLFAVAGDVHGEARAANDLGLVLWQAGRAAEALPPLEAALDLRRRAGDLHGEVQTLANLGLARLAAADLPGAEEALREAAERAPAVGDAVLEAAIAQNLGGVFLRRGDAAAARAAFERALAVHRQRGDPLQQARALLNLAVTSRRSGDWATAEDQYARALELLGDVDAPRTEASARNNLGILLLDRGEAEAALAQIRAALDLRKRSGDAAGQATALDNLGQCLAALGRTGEARAAYEDALELRRTLDDLRGEAASLDHLGQFLADSGAPREAHRRLEAALALRRRADDAAGEVRTLRRLGEVRLALGDLSGAGRALDEALASTRRIGDPDEEAWTLRALGELERRRGRAEEALERFESAVALVESLRPLSGGDRPRAHFLAARREIFADALQQLLELHRRRPEAGFDRRAFELSERGRARALLDLLAGDPGSGDGPAGGGRPARDPAATPTARPLAAEEVQRLLPPGVLLLELALGPEGSALWSVDREGVTLHELPPAQELETLARDLLERYRRLDVGRDDGARRRAETLSRLVLGPVAAELRPGRALLVVPDGAFHGFPWSALPAPPGAAGEGEPLLVERPVAVVPSASVLAALGPDGPPGPWSATVFADPELGPDFAPLPGGRREAALLASLLPPEHASVALGADASRELFLGGGLRGHRLVHVATHAVVDPADRWASGLLLAPSGAAGGERTGLVGAAELYGLELDADLVVLSGCSTTRGARVGGEGLLGLARGFLHAGARRVISTLWPVEDAAATAFAELFYQALLGDGLPPAEALRTAQVGLREDPRFHDPYHWAVFVLHGLP